MCLDRQIYVLDVWSVWHHLQNIKNYHFFFHKPFPQTTSSAALNLFGTLAGHGFVQG
jgi:hypothetical protein